MGAEMTDKAGIKNVAFQVSGAHMHDYAICYIVLV